MSFRLPLRPVATAVLLITLALFPGYASATPNDSAALAGITTGKAFFDVNLAETDRLLLYLKVIEMTQASLKQQQVSPELIVAFRGPAVKLVVKNDSDVKFQRVATLIDRLRSEGVRFEACAVATELFGVDNASILPSITVVGNTFISSIGYQSRGYALIPLL